MTKWIESAHCRSRAHCVACRTSRPFRESIVRAGMESDPEFACPFGVTAETLLAGPPVAPAAVSHNASQWGPPLWDLLHAGAATAEARAALVARITAMLPCGECRTHWRVLLAEMPPATHSAESFFSWTFAAHNCVNVRLGKPEMSLAQKRLAMRPPARNERDIQ